MVDAPASGTEEQRGACSWREQLRPAGLEPGSERVVGRDAVRHRALLAPLAEDPHDSTGPVHVVHVEPAQLPDTDPRRVEQLEDGDVAQPDRAAVIGTGGRCLEQGPRVGGVEHRRQRLVCLGTAESGAGIGVGSPVRSAQAVKTRTAVARRAMVVRALPSVCCLASQLRSARRSSERRSA